MGCDGCCCWSDDGSVEQRSRIIGSDAHQQVADEIGDVVISVSSAVGLLFLLNKPNVHVFCREFLIHRGFSRSIQQVL